MLNCKKENAIIIYRPNTYIVTIEELYACHFLIKNFDNKDATNLT